MADLEALSSHNRSIFQPLSYSSYKDTYAGRLNKIPALEHVTKEFDKADNQVNSLQEVHAKARNLAGDNQYVKNYINNHENELNNLTNLNDPYEIQKGVKKLANRFHRDINDDNTKLGVAHKNALIHNENLKKAKNEDELYLAREKEALYNKSNEEGKTGADKYYDSIRQTYKGASLTPLETVENKTFGEHFNDTLAHWSTDKKANANYGIEAKKGANGEYIVTRTGTNEFISEKEAKNAAIRAYDTNPNIQSQVAQQAKIDVIKMLDKSGKGLGHTDKPEIQQLIKAREEKLANEFKNQFYNKLQFNKEEKNIHVSADPFYLESQKGNSSTQEGQIASPTRFSGVYNLKNVNPYSQANDLIKEQEAQKAFIKYNGNILSNTDYTNQLIKEGKIKESEKGKFKEYLEHYTTNDLSHQIGSTINYLAGKPITSGFSELEANKYFTLLHGNLNEKPNVEFIDRKQAGNLGNSIKDKWKEDWIKYNVQDGEKVVNRPDIQEKAEKEWDLWHNKTEQSTFQGEQIDQSLKNRYTEKNQLPLDISNETVLFPNGETTKGNNIDNLLKDYGVKDSDEVWYVPEKQITGSPEYSGGREYRVYIKDKDNKNKGSFNIITKPPVDVQKILQPIDELQKYNYEKHSAPGLFEKIPTEKGYRLQKVAFNSDLKHGNYIEVLNKNRNGKIVADVAEFTGGKLVNNEPLDEWSRHFYDRRKGQMAQFGYTTWDKKTTDQQRFSQESSTGSEQDIIDNEF